MRKTVCLLIASFGSFSFLMHAEQLNNGEDVTRPLSRFDMRVKYQTGADAQNGNDLILTARTDLVFDLPHNWLLGIRLDLPYNFYRCPSTPTSTPCSAGDHIGDLLLQCLIATPTYNYWTFAFGSQFYFPTGGANLEFGDGKYQILPTVAIKYDLGFLSEGSYCGVLMRQDNDLGGYHVDPPINQTHLEPFLNINLPCHWFMTFSPEMFYDWVSHRWFIPFDVMIGKMLTPRIVTSIEYETAIVREYPEFRQEIEFRIGYFF